MNVLTKAFVVVVTILSVILVTLVVSFAAQVPNYAQQFKDKDLALRTQIKDSSEEVAKIRAEMAEKGTAAEEYSKQVMDLNSKLSSVTSDRTALEARIAELQNTMARLTAALEVAGRVNENKDAQIAEMSGLVNQQIAMIGDQQGQVADLTQTLINVREDNRRLANNYLRIQEENKALAQRNEEMQASIDGLKTVLVKVKRDIDIDKELSDIAVKPKGDTVIRGSVVKIEQVKDLTFVQVNVGTRDQVKEGMEFTVHRGDTYIGNIKIASVDIDESVGRLTLSAGPGIEAGDAIKAGGR